LVDINLLNGIILTCKILKFDNFSLLIDYNNKTLIFKHSIAFITFKKLKKNKK